MRDLQFKAAATILTEACNDLRFRADEIRSRRFNPRLAVSYGDTRTEAERERDFNRDRDKAVAALTEAESLIKAMYP